MSSATLGLRTRQSGKYVVLVVASLVTLVPLVIVAMTAFFKPGTPISGVSFPHSLNWSTFSSAWISWKKVRFWRR